MSRKLNRRNVLQFRALHYVSAICCRLGARVRQAGHILRRRPGERQDPLPQDVVSRRL